ncbi:MAG: T9SS type A sorting domain-containing protein, partial [Fibromonadales bacterium]|nr:T9SS type A sorting domain-containing protein [Fibromonadales bacterium]
SSASGLTATCGTVAVVNATTSSSSAVAVSSSSSEESTPIISNIPVTYLSEQALNGVVEIFDIKGNKVASVNVSDPQAVKLSLPSGLYFAKALGKQSVKFVVK